MFLRLPVLLALFAFASCNHESEHSSAPAKTVASLPESLALKSPPQGAIGVYDARKDAVAGSEVVLTGRAQNFLDTQAGFTIVDMSLASCAEEGDSCATPWDYCCVDPTKLAEGTAVVELRDGAAVAPGSAKGWNGLDHLKQVVVRGKLERDAKNNLTVVANGVYVQN